MMRILVRIIMALFPVIGVAWAQQKLDVEGHRGGMGLMPENTIASMLNGVKTGVRTLELDVVISADGKVVVSHDPFMSSLFMRKPDGSDISTTEEKSLLLYKMPYDSIRQYDAGSKPHPRFPNQEKFKTYRPLLSDLIDSVEHYVKSHHLKPVFYNIETKIDPAGDNSYNPVPEVFVKTMMEVLDSKPISGRLTVQSFDVRTLQLLHNSHPKLPLSLLVSKVNLQEDIRNLGFSPQVYSPYYVFLTPELVKEAHQKHILVLPWTVDEEKDMVSLEQMGVDGIISNYPDRLVKLFGSYQEN